MKVKNQIGYMFTFSVCLIFCLSIMANSQESKAGKSSSDLADSFIKIAEQQEREYEVLRNSGFNATIQNMGKYQASMVEKNTRKTEIVQTLFTRLNAEKGAKIRLEGWKAINKILNILDLDKLKKVDEDSKKNGYYGFKLHDFAIILDISYSEIKETLTKASNQEKDTDIKQYSSTVIDLITF